MVQEVLEERDQVDIQPAVYASLPRVDDPIWRLSHPAQRSVDRNGNYLYDSAGNLEFRFGTPTVILYLLRTPSDGSGWAYLHSIASGELIHSLAPNDQSGLEYHNTTEGVGVQWCAGVHISCHGSSVKPIGGGPSLKVGKWSGEDQEAGISFTGSYANGSPCGSWVIHYPRKVRVPGIDYGEPASYRQSTMELSIKSGATPEILSQNYRSK